MPWLKWWDETKDPPILDGAPRWNNYEDPAGETIWTMSSALLDPSNSPSSVDEINKQLKLGPYAMFASSH